MSLINSIKHDIKSDMRAAMRIRPPWWCLLSWAFVCLLIIWPLEDIGKPYLVYPTLASLIALGFTTAVKWELRTSSWFWITMTILAALHLPLILLLPWTSGWIPAPAIAAVASADFVVMLAIVDVLAKFMTAPTRSRRRSR